MEKLFKTIATALCLGACVGSFALGGATEASAALPYGTMEELDGRTPECALILEEAKIKNMTDWGYYNVDGQDVWYFSGDNKGGEGKNPEIRFITDGTQTQSKPYTYAPMTVERFSFSYRIDNQSSYNRVDDTDTQYIVQILCSDGSYPIILPEIEEDGAWHTIRIDQFTPVTNSFVGASTYAGIGHLFSGFLFKMAGLDGDFMIGDIEVVANGAVLPPLNPIEEPCTPPETSEMPETSETESESADLVLDSEEPETSENPVTSEAPVTSDLTSEPAISNEEGILDMLGCNATVSGAYALFALAGAGFVMAIRKRKE